MQKTERVREIFFALIEGILILSKAGAPVPTCHSAPADSKGRLCLPFWEGVMAQ